MNWFLPYYQRREIEEYYRRARKNRINKEKADKECEKKMLTEAEIDKKLRELYKFTDEFNGQKISYLLIKPLQQLRRVLKQLGYSGEFVGNHFCPKCGSEMRQYGGESGTTLICTNRSCNSNADDDGNRISPL